jgi:serpin B
MSADPQIKILKYFSVIKKYLKMQILTGSILLFSLYAITNAGGHKNIALNKPVHAQSSYLDAMPENAVDGNITTCWNSGTFHPSWLWIDLKGNYNIDSININLAQTPAGLTAFQAWAYNRNDSMMVARWEEHTVNGSWLRKGFDSPLQNINKIRICSEYSPSWIALYEVVIIGTHSKKRLFSDREQSIPKSIGGSPVDSNVCFAVDLYKKLSSETENVIFSPFSISSALAMSYAGARSNTEKEMAKVLHFGDDKSVHLAFQKTSQSFELLNDQKTRLLFANSLWPQKQCRILSAYIDLLKLYYGVSITCLDFKNDPETARQTINAWISKETIENINDLIPTGMLNQSTRLVLTNALYFKSPWALQFDKDNTIESNFYPLSGNIDQTTFMQKTAEFRFAETDTMKALEIPYQSKQLSMIILLPKRDNFKDVESSLSQNYLSQVLNSLAQRRVRIAIPKFKMEHSILLSKKLSSMGMPSAFNGGDADFSGMTGTKNLFISEIIHKVIIELSEEGTVAAAATGIAVQYISDTIEPEPKEFIADHPFVFIIRHNETGNILFMGRFMYPE